MSQKIFHLFLLSFFITKLLCQNNIQTKSNIRFLKANPLLNITTKNSESLKLHSKLLQTVYSDSYSKNFYYTTLYVGHNKVRQTYVIDTGSSIMASPCSPCPDCGPHKSPFYYDKNRHHKPLKCSSKICQLTPATGCVKKKLKFLSSDTCSFKIGRAGGEGIMGYYMKDIVYLEIDKKYENSTKHRKSFRSYALPVGCTTAELGKYKELTTDGIMGMNNNPKSFISLLYNLKIINRNIFSLCFGLRGGYMSLGEIDKTYHKSKEIEYIPLLTSNIYYLVKLSGIRVGKKKSSNAIKNPVLAIIDTGNSISYFPSIIFKNITKQFALFCQDNGDKCGNFTYDDDLGYCSEFPDRETLFKAIYNYWPNITLYFDNSKYIWKPINYYYYLFNMKKRKACLGFNYHSSEKVILGANFIHGHDIIFDRNKKRLGFVPADCSRGNLIWNKWQGLLGNKLPKFEKDATDPIIIDKKIHHGEAENKFHLGDNNKDNMVDFIQGHNTELDKKELTTVNYIILISSIFIVIVVIVLIFSFLLCTKKKLIYEQQETEYNAEDTPNQINTLDDNSENNENNDNNENNENNENKIFDDNNQPETKLEDGK